MRAFFSPYFFDLLLPGVTGEESRLLEGGPQFGVQLAQGPGDAQPEGAGLTGHPAAVDGHVDVPRLGRVGEPEGLGDDHPVGRRGEVLLELLVVDGDGSLTGTDAHPGDGPLAASGGLADGSGSGHDGFLAFVGSSYLDGNGAHAPLRVDAVRRGARNLQGLGGLGGVGVVSAPVDLQLAGHLATQAVLRQHAPDGVTHHLVGTVDHQVRVAGGAETAGIAAVPIGQLGLGLVRGEHHLVGVDHDDVVTDVDMGGEGRLVLAAQHRGHLGGQSAQHQSVGVDDPPGTGDVGRFG